MTFRGSMLNIYKCVQLCLIVVVEKRSQTFWYKQHQGDSSRINIISLMALLCSTVHESVLEVLHILSVSDTIASAQLLTVNPEWWHVSPTQTLILTRVCVEIRKPGQHTGVRSGVTVSQTSRHYSSAICGGKNQFLLCEVTAVIALNDKSTRRLSAQCCLNCPFSKPLQIFKVTSR